MNNHDNRDDSGGIRNFLASDNGSAYFRVEMMTNDELEAQSRAAIIAHLTDPSVQLEYTDKSDPQEKWFSLVENAFYLDSYYYRIARPKKWYRVAKLEGGTFSIDSALEEKMVQDQLNFIKWLDERKYYD